MSQLKQKIEDMNLKEKCSQVKQKIEDMNLKEKCSQVKQKIEDMNLKEKWSTFTLKLDQLPIPKWLLIITTSISVIVAIVALVPNNSTDGSQYAMENFQSDPSEEYDVMLEEFALKADRLLDLVYDMKNSDHPFMYTKQVETLATECQELERKLSSAPLNSRQKLYKDEIKTELEDAIRRLTWN